jgi:translocator protein
LLKFNINQKGPLDLINDKASKLLVCIGAAAGTAFWGTIWVFTSNAAFDVLNRPSWMPPSWLYVPMWTFLYIMLALILYHMWRYDQDKEMEISFRVLGIFWLLHLITPIYFYRASLDRAVVLLIFQWVALTILAIRLRKPFSSRVWLLMPLWLWIGYMNTICIAMVFLNP